MTDYSEFRPLMFSIAYRMTASMSHADEGVTAREVTAS